MKKFISLLIICSLLTSFVACSNPDSGNQNENNTNADSPSVNAETESETEAPDPFADVDYGGRSFRVYTSVDTTDATNGDAFIRGTGEYNGEAVNDAVYDRNTKVSELLGINLEFIEANYNYGTAANSIKTQIQAGDDAWDVIANDIRALAGISSEGYLKNIYNNSILNLDAEYWYSDSMNDLMFIKGGMYLLVGDYFTDALASCHALYVNEEILNNVFSSQNYINDMVFDGKWTIDEMTKIVEQCYNDIDGNGEKNAGDTFGYICVGMWGSAIPMLLGQDITFVTKTDDSVEFAFNTERSVAILDKLYNLYYSTGTYTSVSDVAALQRNFANKETLIMGYNRLGDLANLREIDFPFGVIPYPKFDAAQENYNTSLHDTTEIGAIPSNIVGSDLEFVLTCLEVFGRETGKTVIPEYYENGLKVKYADGQDDAKMIDLIHDSICSPFAVAYDSTLGNFLLANVFLNPLANNSINFASSYEKNEKLAIKLLNRTTDAFKSVLESGN